MIAMKFLAGITLYFALSLMLTVLLFSINKKDFKKDFILANIFLVSIAVGSSIIGGLIYVILM